MNKLKVLKKCVCKDRAKCSCDYRRYWWFKDKLKILCENKSKCLNKEI